MKTRLQLLESLVNFGSSWENSSKELQQFPWDSEIDLVILTAGNVVDALRTTNETSDFGTLERWANLIEAREDLGFEKSEVKEVIEMIANPSLHGTLDRSKINSLIEYLSH